MTWKEFNEIVRTYLLVDAERKGKGMQRYINRMIVASVIDMQRYVPGLRKNQVKHYSTTTLVEPNPSDLNAVNAEDLDAHQGTFNEGRTRIKQVVVRRIPTEDNNQDVSRYFYPKMTPWENRFLLIDGPTLERTVGIPGRITFGETTFITGPKLRDDEALYVYYEGERHFTPYGTATEDELADPVVFDDLVAKASSDYVKAHLAREVDNDLVQYQSYFKMYQKERSQIFINEEEYAASSADQLVGGGVGGGEFVVG